MLDRLGRSEVATVHQPAACVASSLSGVSARGLTELAACNSTFCTSPRPSPQQPIARRLPVLPKPQAIPLLPPPGALQPAAMDGAVELVEGPCHAEVTPGPLSLDKCVGLVGDGGAGAIATFVGITRNCFQGKRTERLEYEAYVPMAARKLLVGAGRVGGGRARPAGRGARRWLALGSARRTAALAQAPARPDRLQPI